MQGQGTASLVGFGATPQLSSVSASREKRASRAAAHGQRSVPVPVTRSGRSVSCSFLLSCFYEHKPFFLPFIFSPPRSSRLRTRRCYFLARQKVTKERPEGAEKLMCGDFSPLWTPPAVSISGGVSGRTGVSRLRAQPEGFALIKSRTPTPASTPCWRCASCRGFAVGPSPAQSAAP